MITHYERLRDIKTWSLLLFICKWDYFTDPTNPMMVYVNLHLHQLLEMHALASAPCLKQCYQQTPPFALFAKQPLNSQLHQHKTTNQLLPRLVHPAGHQFTTSKFALPTGYKIDACSTKRPMTFQPCDLAWPHMI